MKRWRRRKSSSASSAGETISPWMNRLYTSCSSVNCDFPKKGTRATLSATVPAGQTEVVLDFSSALIMPPTVGIAEARCSLLSSSFATGLAAAPMGNKLHVTLERAAPADAENGVAVLCDVDQSQRSCAAH